MTTIFCLWLVSLYDLFHQPSSHELRMQPFYRGARSSTLSHSGDASRGNREKGVSAGWGRVRCCGGAGRKYFLPPFGVSAYALEATNFNFFLIVPLSSDVKAIYI